ncbi:MAG TPA: c-type cytochrome biogenesis protein CcmI [Xanthomonadales bacterium]|nr:c-type cytochrome biogenesis protein CcmI [Xanthomonadales bacterium]
MTATFWACAIAMVAVALVLVLRPLLRREAVADAQSRKLAALEAARVAGVLDETEYARKRSELAAAGTQSATPPAPLAIVLVVALLLPLAAVLIYRWKGTPQAMDPAFATQPAEGSPNAPTMDQAISGLAARLEAQPNDIDGWVLLGRAYRSTERFAEASKAFERALELAPDDPDLRIEAVETRVLASADRTLAGEPRKVIDEVLANDPMHQRALWLLGVSEAQVENYPAAVAAWEKLLPQLPAGESVTRNVQTQIAEARLRGKLPASTVEPGPPLAGGAAQRETPVAEAPAQQSTPAAAGGPRLVVTVDVAPALRGQVDAGSTLFVFARMPEGPKMPLAIQKLAVAQFPVTVTLDDTMGMTPAFKLSTAAQVVVGARISKSGIANAQSGDLEAFSAPLAPQGEVPVTVTIDSVVP